MKTKIINADKKIYPIWFKGKLWERKDCHSLFISYYTGKRSMSEDCFVYIADGLRIQPDGTLEDDD
jgi:hypothetical protein